MHGTPLNLKSRAHYLLLLPVLAVGLLPGPVLLGVWESLTFYHTFGAVDAPLSFLIAPRANIAGQGYALLEMARSLIQGFHLPLDLATFRIPSIVFSGVSLILFFIIGRRWFGPWPSLGATALLAGNQVFFQVGHMMTVLVVSGAALLLLIERLQALELRYGDAKAWIGAGLAMAFVALHYGVARIFAVMLIVLWLVRALWLLWKIPGSAATRRGILVLAGYAAAACLAALTLLDYRNLLSMLLFPHFLFPPDSDIAVLQYAPGADGVAGVAGMLGLNLQILFDSVFARIGDYHSRFSSYVFADFRYPLLDLFVVPFALLGLVVAVARLRRRTMLFAMPWANVLAMLAVFTLPVLFSLVLIKPEGPFGTLSVHRMYFCLFPLHLLVAAFLHWLGETGVHRAWKLGAAACVLAVFTSLVAGLVAERARFESQVTGTPAPERWNDGMPNRDRRGREFTSHLQQHAQYANVARQIARKLGAKKGLRRIVYVDVNEFPEAPVVPAGMHYIANRNYHSIFLALYAGEAGVQLNPVVMLDPGRKPVSPGLMAGLAYRGKPREYSALTELDAKGRLAYKSGEPIIPVIVQLSGASDADVLVTTPEEEAGARSLLEKQGTPFEVVRI